MDTNRIKDILVGSSIRKAGERANSTLVIAMALLLLGAVVVNGCTAKPQKPAGTLSVSELLENPMHDAPVRVYGQVKELGELRCPCFYLVSDGESILVWYALVVEEDEISIPSVSVGATDNGDWAIVAGALKASGSEPSADDFGATSVELVQ